MQTQTRAFRAPDYLWSGVVAAADTAGISVSEVIRRGLAAYDPVKRAIGPVADRRWQSGRSSQHEVA